MPNDLPERVLLVGPGQLGRVLAGGLAALGVSIDPVLRGEPIAPTEAHQLVLVAVGERDLDEALQRIPASHRGRVALLQNELLPPDWRAHGIVDPTVLVVWFEKKRGRAIREVRTTEIAGPHAPLFARALDAMDVHAEVLADDALEAALVVKNLYIVGANTLGLALEGAEGGSTTGALVARHRAETRRVLRELLAIERARLSGPTREPPALDEERLLARTIEAFLADPDHGTLGRTARERLTRALERARRLGVEAPALEAIARSTGR